MLQRPGSAWDPETTDRVLSDAILAALTHCEADLIECHADGTLTDREDFIRLCRIARPDEDSAAASHPTEAEAARTGDPSLIEAKPSIGARAPFRQPAALAGTLRARLAACQPAQLGLGAQPPLPEWGAMISSGRSFIFDQWWVATMPGFAIVLVSLGFCFLGDGLRDVLDPKSEGEIMTLLSVEDLRVSFPSPQGRVNVVDGVLLLLRQERLGHRR